MITVSEREQRMARLVNEAHRKEIEVLKKENEELAAQVLKLNLDHVEGRSEQLICFDPKDYTGITKGNKYEMVTGTRTYCPNNHYLIKNDNKQIKCYLKSCFKAN